MTQRFFYYQDYLLQNLAIVRSVHPTRAIFLLLFLSVSALQSLAYYSPCDVHSIVIKDCTDKSHILRVFRNSKYTSSLYCHASFTSMV